MPTFNHEGFVFTIDDAWWAASKAHLFVPAEQSYRAAAPQRKTDRAIRVISIAQIEPLIRQLSHGPFNDEKDGPSAETRVTALLTGFVSGAPIPPIEILRADVSSQYEHRLYHGAHRYWCSVAVGFTHIPAIDVD
jgi:hypothetical protein